MISRYMDSGIKCFRSYCHSATLRRTSFLVATTLRAPYLQCASLFDSVRTLQCETISVRNSKDLIHQLLSRTDTECETLCRYCHWFLNSDTTYHPPLCHQPKRVCWHWHALGRSVSSLLPHQRGERTISASKTSKRPRFGALGVTALPHGAQLAHSVLPCSFGVETCKKSDSLGSPDSRVSEVGGGGAGMRRG